MIDNGVIGIGFGAYLGVIYHAKYCPGFMGRELAKKETWYTQPLLRVLLGFALCFPFMTPYLLTTEQISNIYVLALFKTFLPTFCGGIVVFGPLDQLSHKLHLLKFQELPFEAKRTALAINSEATQLT